MTSLRLPRHLLLIGCCVVLAQRSSAETRTGEETPPPELGSTSVEGSQEGEPDASRVPASVVEMDFTSKKGNQTTDAGDVVRYVPGVSIPVDVLGDDPFVPYGNSGFSSYRIRGVGGNRLLLTIDGIRQPPAYDSTQNGGVGRTFFDPRVYGGVQILKGAGSAQYGSEALGGAIGFRSLSLADELEYSVHPWLLQGSATYSTVNDSINGVARAGIRAKDVYISATDSYTTGHERKNDKGDVDANPLDFDQNHLLASLALIPSEEHRLSLTAEHFIYTGQTRLKSAEHTPAAPDVNFVYTENTNRRVRASADYRHTPNAGWWDALTLKVYAQQSENDSLNLRNSRVDFPPPIPPLERNRTDLISFSHETLGGNLAFNHRFDLGRFEHNLNHGLELGFEHAENTFERSSVANGVPVPEVNPFASDPADIHRAELFVEDGITRGRWTLTGGLRLNDYRVVPENSAEYLALPGNEYQDDYHNLALAPSLSIECQMAPSTLLWARYARGIRNPALQQLVGYFNHGTEFFLIANPDLEAETGDTFEIGTKFNPPRFQLDASLFYTFYKGFIDTVETTVTNSAGTVAQMYDNVGDVDIYGVELGLNVPLGEWWDPLGGFFTGTKVALSEGVNRTEDDTLDSVDPFEAVVYLGYDHASGKWGTQLTGIYRAKKREVSEEWGDQFVPPSSFVVDCSAYWNITQRVSIEATLRNLTNQKYWLWSNSGRTTHSFNENKELYVQPGINAALTLNVAF